LWPFSEWGVASAEAGATLWIGGAAALIAIWGVISQRAIARRQVTMDHIASIEADRDLIAARARYISLTSSPGALVALADNPPEDASSDKAKDMRKDLEAVRLVFNSLELIAIGIQLGIVDYALYKRFARSSIVKDWDRGAPLIYALRRKHSQPSMYHEFEELARWMRDNNMPRRRRLFSLWR
jgi:hypothetical protein